MDLIVSHLDKEIEDLNQHINSEDCNKTRKMRLKLMIVSTTINIS